MSDNRLKTTEGTQEIYFISSVLGSRLFQNAIILEWTTLLSCQLEIELTLSVQSNAVHLVNLSRDCSMNLFVCLI